MGDAPLTAQQVVSLLGSVIFRIAAPEVARNALLAGLADAGLEDLASLVLKARPSGTGGDAPAADAGGKKAKKRKRGKGGQGEDGNESEGAKKQRKPRQLSLMNMFTPFIFEMMQKDPTHPAFKLPTRTDDNGNTVPARGAQMTVASNCWKGLSDQDKARLGELLAPYMKQVNEAISADEGKPEHLFEQLKAFLAEKKSDKEVTKIINRSVESATGFNPSKPSASGGAGPVAPASGGKGAVAASKPGTGALASSQTSKGGKGEPGTATKPAQDPKKAAANGKADAKATAKQQEALKKQKEEEERKRKQQQAQDDDDDDDSDDDDDDDE